jgi:hypothetical protein
MEIKLGNYNLINSISVIQIDDLPIRIELPDTFGEIYVITFHFTRDDRNKSTITRTDAIDRMHLNVYFVNFNDPVQIGNIDLLELGTLQSFPLYLSYRVTPLKGATKTILFNFYIREEV